MGWPFKDQVPTIRKYLMDDCDDIGKESLEQVPVGYRPRDVVARVDAEVSGARPPGAWY